MIRALSETDTSYRQTHTVRFASDTAGPALSTKKLHGKTGRSLLLLLLLPAVDFFTSMGYYLLHYRLSLLGNFALPSTGTALRRRSKKPTAGNNNRRDGNKHYSSSGR